MKVGEWWKGVNAPAPGEQPWSWPRRFGFRWLLLFWGLGYGLPPPLNQVIPSGSELWTALASRLGAVLHLDVPQHGPSGSGDTLLDWLTKLTLGLVALVGASLWSAVQRGPVRHGKLLDFLQLYVRLTLFQSLATYGVIKLFDRQFPAPTAERLLSTFGEASPMGLMWTFLGASRPYEQFGGAMECLAAVLLVFRRTRLLGALVACGVMGNVFMLNLCYDVPVKLFSGELLAMSAFLVALDSRRLLELLLLNRQVAVADEGFVFFATGRWRLVRAIAVLVAVAAQVVNLWPFISAKAEPPDPASVEGAYDVVSLEGVEGLTRLGMTTWSARVWATNADPLRLKLEEDPRKHHVTLAPRDAEPGLAADLTWTQEGDRVTFTGTWKDAPVTIVTTRRDLSKSLLLTRGFHWVNEFPFNR